MRLSRRRRCKIMRQGKAASHPALRTVTGPTISWVTPIAVEAVGEVCESHTTRESHLPSPSESLMNDSKIIAMRSVAHLAPDTPQMNAAALPAFGVTDG